MTTKQFTIAWRGNPLVIVEADEFLTPLEIKTWYASVYAFYFDELTCFEVPTVVCPLIRKAVQKS